jgi:hypothetical protein
VDIQQLLFQLAHVAVGGLLSAFAQTGGGNMVLAPSRGLQVPSANLEMLEPPGLENAHQTGNLNFLEN